MLPTDLALIRSKRDVDLLQRFDPLRRQRVADLLEPLLGAHCAREQRSFFFSFFTPSQGGRTWQAFGGGKNVHETFRQARIYNFRDKCVVFARNLKFLNLTQ